VHAARGFPGITVIPPGKEAERLGELPVDVLFAGGNDDEAQPLLETLDRWGVRTFHALATLPEIAVSERLGQNGLRWQKLARGAGGRPLLPAEPPLQFVEVLELEHPVAMLEPLAFLLGRLLEQVCARLGARALATNELRLALFVDDVSGFTFHGERENDQLATPNRTRETVFRRALRLPVPMLDSRVFLKLLQLDLKAHPPPAPVVKIEMAAEPVRPQQAQGGLFLAVAPEPDRLELTLARIAAVLRPKPKSGEERPTFSGEVLDRVGSAELLDTHRPDAFRMVRFAPPAPGATAPRRRSHGSVQREDGAARDNVNEDCSKRPTLSLRRFRPPLPAKVEQRQDRPVRLWTERSDIGGEVVTCSGPWRTSGDWWEQKERGGRKQEAGSRKDNGQWNREEWDVVIGAREGVALYRIYCDLASGRWFVEASYD
jgi:protein ImuB